MRKKVWIMNHYATNMFYDEGGRHHWFAKNLQIEGYEPVIFCANTLHNSLDVINTNGIYKEDSSEGVPYVFVKTTSATGNGLARVKNMALFAWNLKRVARKYAKRHGKPDMILASSVHPLTLVAGILIGKKLNVPVICEVRDLWPEAIFAFDKAKEKSLVGRLLTAGEYWIYRKADALIFTKEGDTDYLIEKKWDTPQGGKINLQKAFYINNGVDIYRFNKSIENNILEDDDLLSSKFTVTYVGAIRPVNNVENLVHTAEILKENNDIDFIIYGDGIHRPILEKYIDEHNLSNVKLKGFVNKKFIPFILSKSNLNILNYSSEKYNWSRGNSSNKLFEYMASGKPVISTAKMGYSIINKYSCGSELEENTPDELANAILYFKNLPKNEYNTYRINAKDGVKDFDFKVLTKKLIDVIESTNKQ